MLVRIVKLQFQTDKIEAFKELFAFKQDKIRNFEGCSHLELWQDQKDPSIFFTYSHWESQQHLDNYRHSAFFRNTWTVSKSYFSAKPKAWSVDKLVVV